MKPLILALLALPGLALPTAAAELTSAYTTLDHDKDCHIINRAENGEGDFADLVCPGFAGYPYVIRYGDGREAATYGFATDAGMPTFGPFNYANGTVEWRVSGTGDVKHPVAAIQRWFLADQDGKWTTPILVVSRVGQPSGGGACVIGYVSAQDGAPANERARLIADRAESHACGTDPVEIEDAIREFVPPE